MRSTTVALIGLALLGGCRAKPMDELFPRKASVPTPTAASAVQPAARAEQPVASVSAATEPTPAVASAQGETSPVHPAVRAALNAISQEAMVNDLGDVLKSDTIAVIVGYLPSMDVGASDSVQIKVQVRVAGLLVRDRTSKDSLGRRFAPRNGTQEVLYVSRRVGGAWSATRVSAQALVFVGSLMGRKDVIALSEQDWQRIEKATRGG